MVSNKDPNDPPIDKLDFICDLCQSTEVIECSEGYVCTNCGLVLELPRMEYHRPYENDRIQHAVPLGTTRIGSEKERFQHQHSLKLRRLQKIQQTGKTNYNKLLAEVELSRLLTGLSLSCSLKVPLLRLFKDIRKKLSKGTKYRNPEKLLPTVLYFYCKQENIAVDEAKLLEIAKIEKKDYNYCKLTISSLMPHYYERNRKDLILTRILGLTEGKKLGMAFYYDAKRILLQLWEGIKCTTDDVIAGLVSSIAVLCHFQEKVTVSSICKALNIRMSTIQSQVKRKLVDRFKIEGFESLVKSAGLIKSIMYKLGIFKRKNKEKKEPPKGTGINPAQKAISDESKQILIKVSIKDTQNNGLKLKSNEIYTFKLTNSGHLPILVYVNIERNANGIENKKAPSKEPKRFKIHSIIYYYPTGPPVSSSS
ncbi:MAG: hypothetical protein BAJALOKI1v1_430007 [Promethearchaeota archaeon]|nr:MAG: hypothetical protein BAJALOKI1v1_430007 [Candidatus Lokiarchaeota archaeon]